MFEFLLTLFRLEERARAYFVTTILNVAGDDRADRRPRRRRRRGRPRPAARQLRERRRLRPRPDRRCSAAASRCASTAPCCGGCCASACRRCRPRSRSTCSTSSTGSSSSAPLGLAEAGLYSLAVKFAQAVNVLVRGFQLAWPPLAYSIRDDDEARRAYATVVTLFVAGCAFVVTGMWLFSRWIVRALAAPKFFDSYEAIGLIATAVTLYALYMVLVVILGRTGRTEFNLPATIAALVANVVLNLLLVPPLGIVGAGLALVASYLVVLALMYVFTQRLFPVPYEWGRLARVVLAVGGAGRRSANC